MNPDISTIREAVDRRLADLRVARTQCKEESRALELARERVQVLQEAQQLAQAVAQQVQEQAHFKIANVVTRALQAVFDDPYVFHIVFERKRGRTEARLVFERDGQEIDPMDAAGGGVVDVASFALRLSCLLLSRPPVRKLLVLDEHFKFVHGKQERVRTKAFVEQVAKETGVQILLVTQVQEFVMGTVVEL